MLDRVEAAREELDSLMRRYPDFSFDFYADYFPIADPEARKRYENAVLRLKS